MLDFLNKKNYVNGKWISSSQEIAVDNPATGKIVGHAPDISEEQLRDAVEVTVDAATKWKNSTIEQRYQVLRKWQELNKKHFKELADLITLEQGKVTSEAQGELIYGEAFIDWFACILRPHSNYSRAGSSIEHKVVVEKEPIGPVAAITPWNFPSAMMSRKIAPAIAAGCSVILKPSELTPFSALAQAKLLEEAGLPAGVLNVVTCDAKLFSDIVCNDFRIRKLSFTGSTRVGKLLFEKSAKTVKRLSMELGGNAPYIVFADSDIEKVTDDLIGIKLRSGGQSCTSPNRIFIEDKIYNKFTKLLAEKFSKCKAGDGYKKSSDLGPLINANAVEKINLLLRDAVNHGAKILCGGNHNGNFVEPTVLKDCHDDMNIFSNEIFGPVLACYSFENVEEVIARANNTEYGLQSYLYSKDMKRANYIVSKLDFGMVSVNSSRPATTNAPFAGRKASGFGIEGSHEGIDEYLNSKYININY